MGNRYYLTGDQLGMLMRQTDESCRMKILNKIMNDQQIENWDALDSKNEHGK